MVHISKRVNCMYYVRYHTIDYLFIKHFHYKTDYCIDFINYVSPIHPWIFIVYRRCSHSVGIYLLNWILLSFELVNCHTDYTFLYLRSVGRIDKQSERKMPSENMNQYSSHFIYKSRGLSILISYFKSTDFTKFSCLHSAECLG